MSQYLIDTDMCVFYLKGRYGLIDKVREVGIKNCYVSEITIAELTCGAYKSSDINKHILEVRNIEELFGIIPIYNSLNEYGKERARLEKAGTRLPDFDLLIGVTAVKQNMIMVTNNEKHLRRIENIQIENWIKAEYNQFIKQR